MKTKILFLIHDLGPGGAEKVLVNLVNNMDRSKFDITLLSLFAGGVNERFLKSDIRYRTIFSRTFRGNSHIMKLLSPKQLHKLFIKETFSKSLRVQQLVLLDLYKRRLPVTTDFIVSLLYQRRLKKHSLRRFRQLHPWRYYTTQTKANIS